MPDSLNELSDSLESLYKTAMRIKAQRDALLQVSEAAFHALRSFQYGNGSTELAEESADQLDRVLKLVKHE